MSTIRLIVECTGWVFWFMGAAGLVVVGGYVVTLAVLEYLVKWFGLGKMIVDAARYYCKQKGWTPTPKEPGHE